MEKLVKETLIEDIEILKVKETSTLLKELGIFYKKNLKLNGKELANKFNLFLEQSIKQIFRTWRKVEETKLQQSLKSILDRFSKETNSSIQKVIDLSSNLFDLHIEKFEAGTELAKEQEFRFSFDEFKVDIEIFTPVVSRLPKFLSHGLLYKNARERAEEELDQHYGRVRYDFHQRIIKSINEYRNILDEVLEETINEINTAMKNGLKQKEKGKEEEKSSLIKIQKQEEILTTAKEMIIK